MSDRELDVVKQHLEETLEKGFIETSKAPFVSPILLSRKPDGGLRFWVDYRKLNSITKKTRYPLPLIPETLGRAGKYKWFTKLDIRQAFHRIRIKEDQEDLTTFKTRFGTFRFKVMPFGLSNRASSLQNLLNDTLFEYLDVFTSEYIDDIVVYSEEEESIRRTSAKG